MNSNSPPLQYDFLSPQKIVFGWGRRNELGPLAKSLGNRVFIVCGSRTLGQNGTLDQIISLLNDAGIEAVSLATISREPEVTDVDSTVEKLAEFKPQAGDFLLAIGGGSAIDLAKATSAMITNRESSTVQDYLEGVGQGLQIVNAPLPLLAMPTTSGTGTEATKNAVISCYDPLFKKSLRSDLMVPRIVLIDPELSVSVSSQTTAYTGMDAITQLIESFISQRAKPIPEALCLHGLELAIPAIAEAVEKGQSKWARESMAHAALLSGMALANSGLGMAHGVAAALGVHSKVPHGLACAVMLPFAMRVNQNACRSKIARLGELFTGINFDSEEQAAEGAVDFIDQLCQRLNIPRSLSELGVKQSQLPEIVKSSRGNSMSGNPRELSDQELTTILEEIA